MKNQQLLYIGLEETEGTEATALSVLETVDGQSWTPYDGERVNRNVDKPVVTAGEEVNVTPHQTVGWNIDGAGSGVAGTAPEYGKALQACGFTEDATQPDKVIYTLSNATSKTVSLMRYLGDQFIEKSLGCRGNVSFSFDRFLKMAFSNFKGSYIQPIQGAFPGTVSWENITDPVPMTKENTTACTIDNFSAILLGGNLSAGNGVNWINRPGQKYAQHGKLFSEGSLSIQAPTLAEKNFFAKMESHNGVEVLDFALTHGTVAGNIIKLALSLQISNVTETKDNDEVGFDMTVRGQGPLVLTFE